jgi:transposase
MFLAKKYRLYPTNSQKELIAKHIGSSRFVYNLALETKNAAYLGSKHNFSPFLKSFLKEQGFQNSKRSQIVAVFLYRRVYLLTIID